MKKILATLLMLKFVLFVWPGLAYADGLSMHGRWLDYYEEGDSIRTEQGASVTTRVANQKAGAYLKTGLLKWNLEANSVTFKVKSDNWKNVSVVSIVASNGIKFERAATIDIKTRLIDPPNNEWIQVTAPFSAWTLDGAIDWQRVDCFLFAVADNGNGRATVQISSIVFNRQSDVGSVSITVDDGLSDTNVAERMLSERGLAGTAFIDVDMIGQPGYITDVDVDRLVSRGWQLGGHRIGRLTQLSQEDLEQHTERTYAYLKQKGVDTFEYALPNGTRTDAIIRTLSKRFTTIHNIDGMANDGSRLIQTNVNRHSIDKHTSLAQAKKWVDAAKNGEWVVLNFHTFSDTWEREEDWSEADFVSLVEYTIEQGVPITTTSVALRMMQPPKKWFW